MPRIDHSPVQFRDQNGQHRPARLQTTHYTQQERLRRALLRLGLFWLLALGSIPIVIAHWVLVPGFFLAGPWVGYRTYQLSSAHNLVTGPCPACNKDIDIALEARETLPKWSYCPDCKAPLQITSPD